MAAPSQAALARGVRLYPWYQAAINGYFWAPVGVLYLLSRLPLADVMRLEALFQLAVVALEVPAGYAADRLGGRLALVAGAIAAATGYLLFGLGDGFAAFAAAEVALALGFALRSGADQALHHGMLEALGRGAEFAAREAAAGRARLTAIALAALAGGGLAQAAGFGWVYGLSAAAALLAAGLAFALPALNAPPAEPPWAQLRACLADARQPALAWYGGAAVLLMALDHLPYHFFQPYLQALPGLGTEAALIAGGHVAITMAIGALAAGWGARIAARIGTPAALLGGSGVLAALLAAMATWSHPAVVALLLARQAPQALAAAPLAAAVLPRVGAARRATYLSLQSLAGRIAIGSGLVGLAWAAPAGASGHAAIALPLACAAACGTIAWLALAATRSAARDAVPGP